jgi:hypothetical protein
VSRDAGLGAIPISQHSRGCRSLSSGDAFEGGDDYELLLTATRQSARGSPGQTLRSPSSDGQSGGQWRIDRDRCAWPSVTSARAFDHFRP